MTPLVAAAHDYLAAGLTVMALTGKQPNTKHHPQGKDSAMSGVPENADDDALIRMVFDDPSTTGIALVIQHPYFVVDVDGEDGAVQLRAILGEGVALPATPVAATGRGFHFWLADTTPRRNMKLGTKLDIKAEGGYVAAPPSAHFTKEDEEARDFSRPDAHYEWLMPIFDAESGMIVPPMEAPEGLLKVFADRDLMDSYKVAHKTEYAIIGVVKPDGKGIIISRGEDKLAGLCHAIVTAEDGNQNNMIAWAALTARDEGVDYKTAMELLFAAAIEGGHPADRARATIRSAYRRRGVK